MGNILSDVCDPELVLPFLCGKGKYSQNLEDNLEALQKEMRELKEMKTDLLRWEWKGEGRVVEEVKGWISMVEEVGSEAYRLLDESISVIQRLSMYGYCSRFSASTYRYSKKVEMTLEQVKILISKGVFERPTLLHVKKVLSYQPTVSQEKLLESTWDRLMDENVETLYIYGMGGVGKTTLLDQINDKFSDGDYGFDLVIFVVVASQEAENIQDEIGRRLGLAWGGATKYGKAVEIYLALEGKRFMLLLDDIQKKGLDLSAIGVPFPSIKNGCKSKLVYTTRHQISNWADVQVEVTVLSSDEAWGLFRKIVGETTLTDHPDIPKVARMFADLCGGLPLALKVVGQMMAGKSTVGEWRHTFDRWMSSGTQFKGIEDQILHVIKFSYDTLPGERTRSFFLHCALVLENGFIRKQDLVDHWVVKGVVSDEISGYEMIDDLVGASLLIKDESGYGVLMHSIVREMAYWMIASDIGRRMMR